MLLGYWPTTSQEILNRPVFVLEILKKSTDSEHSFQTMFRICSEFSVNVQTFSEFMAQKLVYSEFLDFVVHGYLLSFIPFLHIIISPFEIDIRFWLNIYLYIYIYLYNIHPKCFLHDIYKDSYLSVQFIRIQWHFFNYKHVIFVIV